MFAEFTTLKDELERLLVKSRGLTSHGKPPHRLPAYHCPGSQETANPSRPSGSLHSNCSSSSSFVTPYTEADEACSESSSTADWQPDSHQLGDDVAALLQQVDTAIARPSTRTESDAVGKTTRPNLNEAHEATASIAALHMDSSPTTRQQASIVKVSGSMPPAHDALLKPASLFGAASTAIPMLAPKTHKHQQQPLDVATEHSNGDGVPDAAISISRQIVGQPDNVTILRAACSVQSPGSHAASAASSSSGAASAAATAGGAASASPHHWHTNSLAHESSFDHAKHRPRAAQLAASNMPTHTWQPDGNRAATRSQSPEHMENVAPHWPGKQPQAGPVKE